MSVPRTTVASIILKWKNFGTTRNPPRVGYLAIFGIQERRALVREVRKNPTVSLKQFQKSCAYAGGLCGWTTIFVALHKSGLRGKMEAFVVEKTYDRIRPLATCGKRSSGLMRHNLNRTANTMSGEKQALHINWLIPSLW